jgi:hypothetical protein
MKTKLITLLLAAATLMGCANAFQDLHDGQGMRGWGGVPLRDTIPLGVAMAEQQAALANERAARTPVNVNVWHHGTIYHDVNIY